MSTELTVLRHAALMSSASAQLVLDAEGRLAFASNRAMDLLGLSALDIGRPIQDLEVWSRPVELRAHLEEARARHGAIWVRDVEQVRRSGETVLLDVELVPLADESGTDLGTTVIFDDVTQRRQLREELTDVHRELEVVYAELRSTNQELETTNVELQSTVEELETMNDVERLNGFMVAVLGSTTSSVVVVDGDLQVLAWNNRAEDLWGVRTDEAVGEHLTSLDIGLPVEQLRRQIRSRLAAPSGEPVVRVLEAVDRGGHVLTVRAILTPIREHGEMTPAVMLVMDVVSKRD